MEISKELKIRALTVLKNEYYGNIGLCSVIAYIAYKRFITNDQKHFLNGLLEEEKLKRVFLWYAAEGFKDYDVDEKDNYIKCKIDNRNLNHNYDPFIWKPYEVNPRIKWINKQIKMLKDEKS